MTQERLSKSALNGNSSASLQFSLCYEGQLGVLILCGER